ncbi:MAG: molecular chaperone DnaJ [Opitutaceae bacterium]|nr:molecular chaperone DnaJ [Opitutaceae bacterium]
MRSTRFKDLVSKNPDNEMFRFSLAQALFNEEDFSGSLPHFQKCIEKKPEWMMATILLGKAHLNLQNRKEALPLLKKALTLAIEQDHEEPESELKGILSDLGV